MNRILYALIGGVVAVAIAIAILDKQSAGKIGTTDIAATILFVLLLGCVAWIMASSSWGRKQRSRIDQRQREAEDRAHADARREGKVRKQTPGPLP